jgi:four helix bundle protein
MIYTFPFEKLEVWQLARQLVNKIYLTTGQFPTSERFGLTSQVNRAVVSVASNIAEGEGRPSKKDNIRFLSIAWSSLMEVMNQLILAKDLGYLTEAQLADLREEVRVLSNKINSLYQYRKNKG